MFNVLMFNISMFNVSVDRITLNLAIIKNIIRHNFWVSFVKFLLANVKISLEKQENIVKSVKFLPDMQL